MSRLSGFGSCCSAAAISAALTGLAAMPALAQGAPLETGFYRLPSMATANTLPDGALMLWTGWQQANPTSAAGTGNQLYVHGFEYGVTDRLSFGASIQRFEDPVAIGGGTPDIGLRTTSVQGAYKLIDSGPWQMTARLSAEMLSFRSQFWGSRGGADADHIIGSLHVPVSYQVSPQLQLHATAGVSVFPDNLNGVPFYGVVPSAGVGATWRPTERLGFFGTVNVPFGSGGNTVASSGAITKVPVWTLGGRFNVTPRNALDLYVTNGFGGTPATNITTFYPDGDELVFGARLVYTPGRGPEYRTNYRGIRATPLTKRERRLQFHGLTLGSADTLDAGRVVARAARGSDGNFSGGATVSLDHDFEIGLMAEDYADDGTVAPADRPGTDTRLMFSAKYRLLDQNNGSPFSMSAFVAAGRGAHTRLGSVYVSAPMSYKVSPRVALMAEPKAGAWGSERIYGLGLGVNAELFDGFDVIAEVTPMANGDPLVWSAGARYQIGNSPISLEAQASNSIGNYGVGSMIAQDNVRYSVGVTIALDGKPIWDGLTGR